jgi:hypothetical protein
MIKSVFRPVLWTLLATALYSGAALVIFFADEQKTLAQKNNTDNLPVGSIKKKQPY